MDMERNLIEHMITVVRNDIEQCENDYNTAETVEKKLDAFQMSIMLDKRLAALYEAQDNLP